MSKGKIDKYALTRVRGDERHDDRNRYFITSDFNLTRKLNVDIPPHLSEHKNNIRNG